MTFNLSAEVAHVEFSSIYIKTCFLTNHFPNLTQDYNEDFLWKKNENLYNWSWSHDQDVGFAIYGKNPKNPLLQNQKTNDVGTWYVILEI